MRAPHVQGSSLVEFVLLFPMMLLLISGLFFVVLMGLRQAVLFHEAAGLVRLLALSSLQTVDELKNLASAEAARRFVSPTRTELEIVEIPLAGENTLHQATHRLERIDLRLSQTISFFRWSKALTARAAEIRVRAAAS